MSPHRYFYLLDDNDLKSPHFIACEESAEINYDFVAFGACRLASQPGTVWFICGIIHIARGQGRARGLNVGRPRLQAQDRRQDHLRGINHSFALPNI